MEHQNLLVFLEFPKPTRPSLGLLKSLSYMDITLVGFHSTVDSDESQTDREAEIETTLEEITAKFEEQGMQVEQHVVTGDSMIETRNEWANRDQIDGVLTPGGVNTVGRILVGLRDTRNVEKMAEFIDLIDRKRIIHVTLLHVAPESESESESEATVTGREALKAMKSELVDRGVNPAVIHLQIQLSDDPEHELVTAARNYDLTVLGRTEEPGFKDQVFGPVSNQITDRAHSTVLTVT
ncbi:universal stress protein [Haloplanus aerogenes]|uniref:Nucleotide-binding universal stress UspA family protein n=1 Tax=Haloplanus aerogenes TaxID=660522 RepID=A0A3M0D5I9_9EURY|nr:universal stress protein [Haloplanus aerogenes]AZH25940.1 universal stress protein [Haloplanus aerogenes]RMB11633.1 nucleotide-binding universal stress UspA family protein [Haloplanus aerogenes]